VCPYIYFSTLAAPTCFVYLVATSFIFIYLYSLSLTNKRTCYHIFFKVTDVNVSYYDTSRRRRMTNEAAASINDNINTAVLVHNKDDNNMKMQMQMKEHRDLLTSTGGVLCVFILEIYYLQEDSLNNASSLFKDVERDLTSAIVGGNLTLSILQSAQDASNKVLNNATVSVSASLAAMAKYGKYSSRVIYRRPTHAPTHSPLPTHTPTHSPTHRPSRETDDGDDGGSYSGPNKWLIVVCKDDTYMFILSSSSFFLKKKNFISQHAVLTIHGYYLFIYFFSSSSSHTKKGDCD
jgi:hypothetical protein